MPAHKWIRGLQDTLLGSHEVKDMITSVELRDLGKDVK